MLLPAEEELAALPVESSVDGDEPWRGRLTATAVDGDRVDLSWDAMEHSVTVRWSADGVERLRLDREGVTRLGVGRQGDALLLTVDAEFEGATARLRLSVGAHVSLEDGVLRW